MEDNETVTIVNRTSRMLKGTHNGRPYDLPPGESQYTLEVARFFRFQNPVMGRGTPLEDWSTKAEYLVAIKELGDDCSPREQTDAPQRWDTGLVNGYNVEVVRPRGGGYAPEIRQPLPSLVGNGGEGFSNE